ncbi:hypothetical protein, partial [Cutibacterium granulosum]|uniref:hypothetical protein n=1 Tax=Cutibacterium granulosum TaxID=33011 RepID=UPI002B23983C
TVNRSGRGGRVLVEWTGPADAEARYASSRRADVPELARQAALAHGHGAWPLGEDLLVHLVGVHGHGA